ncbi:MAG: hypothetical protein GX941_08695 [Candidatus Methanofastidiosa archaeon]|jgi:hypothetical protein|nr:hypothetical protein [Candidatus Methanofastidiosa archaeon]
MNKKQKQDDKEFLQANLEMFAEGISLINNAFVELRRKSQEKKPQIEEDSKYDGEPIESDLYDHSDNSLNE